MFHPCVVCLWENILQGGGILRRTCSIVFLLIICAAADTSAGILDDVMRDMGGATKGRSTISTSMNEVGTTKAYKEMMGKYESIPFMSRESVDLDHYVTNKALDGLFSMVGQEEKKIRTDPAARGTELLKTVFGK